MDKWQWLALLVPTLPLAVWYAYHYAHTGFVFGNPEFFRYNVKGNLSPLRIVLALLLRLWQTIGYLSLYVLTMACAIAMKYSAQGLEPQPPKERKPKASDPGRPVRVLVSGLLGHLNPIRFPDVGAVYLLAMSVLGGAVLARYMLPIVPLVILICVSTIWRRLNAWKAVLAIVALSFVLGFRESALLWFFSRGQHGVRRLHSPAPACRSIHRNELPAGTCLPRGQPVMSCRGLISDMCIMQCRSSSDRKLHPGGIALGGGLSIAIRCGAGAFHKVSAPTFTLRSLANLAGMEDTVFRIPCGCDARSSGIVARGKSGLRGATKKGSG